MKDAASLVRLSNAESEVDQGAIHCLLDRQSDSVGKSSIMCRTSLSHMSAASNRNATQMTTEILGL
ncbi:hypothetical protein CDL12_00977 [Handroanthus impetiginosus]|uniref:Uncharacterized protein n=1 Tax=Handroanthus impetiginosus TaxID=429701 RepID=A0A2G9I940_9LAMI|nr:hypothetical protein CDL12_00977 [Handroanthus impetiginosus]